jgi:hypothetical protein
MTLAMAQLVTDIVLVDQDYGLAGGHNRVQAVVEYVNGLTERCLYLEELPLKAIQSYYVDYYMCQVLNGDIGQFVWNSRWNPVIVESVTAALDAIGVPDQAALFAQVRDLVEGDLLRLEAFLDSEYASPSSRPYMDELSKVGGEFFERFTAHPDGSEAGCYQIAKANTAWISSWPEARWVSIETFEQELDELAIVIPNPAERRLKAKEDRPWQHGRIDEVLARSGQKLVHLTGINRRATILGMSGEMWHMLTDQGYHRVMFANREAILLPGDGDEIVARLPAPEAVPKG